MQPLLLVLLATISKPWSNTSKSKQSKATEDQEVFVTFKWRFNDHQKRNTSKCRNTKWRGFVSVSPRFLLSAGIESFQLSDYEFRWRFIAVNTLMRAPVFAQGCSALFWLIRRDFSFECSALSRLFLSSVLQEIIQRAIFVCVWILYICSPCFLVFSLNRLRF